MRSIEHFCNIANLSLPDLSPALGEDGLEVAFKEGAGVLEVLFGVGFGGGDAVKRFVEDADDPLLFGERRECGSGTSAKTCRVEFRLACRQPSPAL